MKIKKIYYMKKNGDKLQIVYILNDLIKYLVS
jgi:hypothetical protein